MNFLDSINYSHILQKYGEDLTEININELIPSEPSVVQSSYNFFMGKLSKGEYIEPIEVAVIDNEYIVVNGNNRAKAFKDFGLDRIQVKIIKVPSFRESFLRKTKSLYEHLKGLEELQTDESYEKRQERYSIKFSHHSKQDIETIIPEDNSILISIAGIHDEFAGIDDKYWKDILRIRFDDIQKDFGKYCAFRNYQAQEILNFVDKNIPVNHIYINCEKGISRSGGIRIGLEKVYNDKDIYLSKFNTHVLKTLLEESKK